MSRNEEDTGEKREPITNTIADGIGSGIEGLFYLVGRASPVVADAAAAVAATRAGTHVVQHAHTGYVKGWNATLENRMKKQRRAGRARFGDKFDEGVQRAKVGVRELVDQVHKDIESLRGNEPQLKPVPGE